MGSRRDRIRKTRAFSKGGEDKGLTPEDVTGWLIGGNADTKNNVTDQIIPQDDGSFQYRDFRLTQTGLIIPSDITPEDYANIGRILLRLEGGIQWMIGDWLAFGEERKWGETYQAVAEEFGYEIDTLYTYAWLSRKIGHAIRRYELSFSHHRLVANMKPDEQAYWLNQAIEEEWSVKQLRGAISQQVTLQIDQAHSPLTDRKNKRVFNKVWQALERGEDVKTAWIDHLQRWLDELKQR